MKHSAITRQRAPSRCHGSRHARPGVAGATVAPSRKHIHPAATIQRQQHPRRRGAATEAAQGRGRLPARRRLAVAAQDNGVVLAPHGAAAGAGLVVEVALAHQAAVLLAGAGQAALLAVLVHGVADPVDTGVLQGKAGGAGATCEGDRGGETAAADKRVRGQPGGGLAAARPDAQPCYASFPARGAVLSCYCLLLPAPPCRRAAAPACWLRQDACCPNRIYIMASLLVLLPA